MKLFQRQDAAVKGGAAAGYSVLDAHVVVRGDIETDGMVRIDGRLEGNILRAAVVVVGAGASIAGNVNARELVVGGSIVGNVVAEARVEVEATAEVDGDIEADAILIHEGGAVRGRLTVRPKGGHPAASARRALPAGNASAAEASLQQLGAAAGT